MTPDWIQKRIATATPFEWRGEQVFLRKIGAHDGMVMINTITGLSEQKKDAKEERAAVINYHADAIAKSLSDKDGKLLHDSDDGRTALKQLPFDDLVSLGDLVLEHSGFGGGEKKSSQNTNASPSDCALHSETPTAPTPTTSSAD